MKIIRRAPDQLISVQLGCIELDNVLVNTWLLVGGMVQSFTCREITEIDSAVFRECLAFMDPSRVMSMDSTGLQAQVIGPLYTMGNIKFGEYTIDINRRCCSCKSWKYHNNKNKDRNCKHLNTLCMPNTIVQYTKQPQFFQLISETVPEQSVYREWLFSQKYDGIRIKVEGIIGWTRGGMKIDLSSIWTPPVGYTYDAELCTLNPKSSTHDMVMACVHAGKINSLQLMVFDIIDDGTQTFRQRLSCLTKLQIPESHMVRYERVDIGPEGPSFIDRLAVMKIGSRLCEGVVVRNPYAYYDDSGQRSNTTIFKVKGKQWKALQPL